MLHVGCDPVFDLFRVLTEPQSRLSLLKLLYRGRDTEDYGCPRVATQACLENLSEWRVSEGYMLCLALGLPRDYLCKVEQTLVDVLTLTHPLAIQRHITLLVI